METDNIEIRATIRQDRPRSIAIWTGELDADGDQVWVFLPKSQIHYKFRGADVTVRLPKWLADSRQLKESGTRRLDELEALMNRFEERIDEIESWIEAVGRRVKRLEERVGLDKPRH